MVKKLSPLYPSSVILTSQVAKQLESERAAEEQKIREQYTAETAALEKEARRQFEADLAAKRAAAEAEFKAGLTAEKSKSTFEADLAAQEAAAKSQFESQLAEQRGRAVEAPLRAAKRQYAMVYGVQMLPRHYRAMRTSAEETYTTLAESEREVMEKEVKTWKAAEVKKQEEAIAAWETEQRGKFAEDLKSWETEAKAGLETQISEWKSQQVAALEPQLKEWREAWQPKGIAERMVEIKVPSLDLSGLLAKAMGLKPIAWTYKGMRIGDVVYTTKGVKPFKAEFAPLAFPAGMVASVESLVYGVGQLAGLKTPRIPATLTGGLVTSGIESAVSWQWKVSPELQALTEMPPEYAAGTVIGDIFVAYGISKGVKAIKGAAKFVYTKSGLKYSHALYKAKELSLAISEHLPKSPIAAIKESSFAYEVSEAWSGIKHKMLPTKLIQVPAEGIIGLPTLEEAPFEGIGEIKGVSKALQTAQAIGLTPLEYEKAMKPAVFAGMELLGWTEAPKTVGFGLTVPKAALEVGKTVAKSPLAEALAETMWIAPSAAEKWAARAGFLKEEWIAEPPKVDVGLKMIKGGKAFSIPQADILGFTKLPKTYRAERTGQFFFEKQTGKIPTLKDLMKDIKAQATTTQLLESPAKIIEPILPKLAMLPKAASKITVSEMIGAGAALGLKPLGKERAKVRAIEKASPLAAEILKPMVSSAAAAKAKVKQAPLLKEILSTTQALKAVRIVPQILKPPKLITKLPRKKEEPFPKIRGADLFGKKPKKKMAGYLYPVMTESEAARYVFGKKVRSKKK